jgi:diguanylate cyclase (GGDEF)-like protein/PAS domain S-box-containing protein
MSGRTLAFFRVQPGERGSAASRAFSTVVSKKNTVATVLAPDLGMPVRLVGTVRLRPLIGSSTPLRTSYHFLKFSLLYSTEQPAIPGISSTETMRFEKLAMIPGPPSPKILLIENDPAVADKIRAALVTTGSVTFEVECVRRLSDGIERLSKGGIAAVLLELSLPDSQGIETFDKLFSAASDVPILVLGNGNEALAKEAVGRGAQDYLLAGHLESYSLPRALRNAIERKAVDDALYAEKERAVVTLNSIGDAVLCTDISGNITYLNLVAESMTGWGREEANGKPLAEVFRIIDGATRLAARDPMEMAVEQNRTVGLTVNCVLIRRDGVESAIEDSAAPIHDRSGHITGAVIVFHDVSAARAMTSQMTHSAQHDVVTNLPNRLLLNDRITQSIALARRQNRPIAVIFLDLDRFKYVNDSLGHAVGDRLLQSVSKRLLAEVRSSDTVSRLGGDEFVILLSEITHPEDAATSATKLLSSLSAPHPIEGEDVDITGSIGISIYPDDGQDAETLIKNADTAMYHAKENGRSNFQFFRADMNRKSDERQSLETSLRRALRRKEFVLHYQPKVSLDTGEITGVEALIRWHQPERGLIPPAQFVPVAEDCGLIVPIGNWVLREACAQAREWQDAGLPFKHISVNVSAAEFRAKTFVAGVRTALRETGLEARYLDLELTESVLMENAQSTGAVLRELKAMGVHLAVDDFGTGYSSLSYLQHFPIDVLKIDKSFVHQISRDSNNSAIVGAIIDMGKNLKQRVIAEGIETADQLTFLQSLHCAEGQGYLFSQPVAPEELAQLLRLGVAGTIVH